MNKDAAQLGALVRFCVDDLEGTGLGVGVAHDYPELQGLSLGIQLQSYDRAWMQAAFAYRHPARQIHLRNLHGIIFLQPGGHSGDRTIQRQTQIAALPRGRRARIGVQRLQQQVRFAQPAAREEILHKFGINLVQRLRGHNSKFGGILPAPNLAGLQNSPQSTLGSAHAQPAQRFHRFQLQIFRGTLRERAPGHVHQANVSGVFPRESDFVQRQRPNQRIDFVEDAQQQAPSFGSTAGFQLAHHPIVRRALPFREPLRQNSFHRLEIQPGHHPQHIGGFGGAGVEESFAQMIGSFLSQFLHNVQQ